MLDKLWSFFMVENHKFSKKFIFSFVLVFFILGADYFFRFSDTYVVEKKIEQLSKINEIVKKDSLSKESKLELLRMEKSVINRHGFWETSSDLISLIQITISSPKAINANTKQTTPIIDEKLITVPQRSEFWHILSSCWFIFILFFVYPFSKKTAHVTVTEIIIVEILLILLAAAWSYILAMIPVFTYPFFNYLLNFFINILALLFLTGMGAITDKINKNKHFKSTLK